MHACIHTYIHTYTHRDRHGAAERIMHVHMQVVASLVGVGALAAEVIVVVDVVVSLPLYFQFHGSSSSGKK